MRNPALPAAAPPPPTSAAPVDPLPCADEALPVAATPFLATGLVRHERLRPRAHRFAYPTWCLLLPMRRLAAGAPAPGLALNRAGWVSFHDADHGAGEVRRGAALAWCEGELRRAGLPPAVLAGGEVWLLTYPRLLGYTFKPVSFWFAVDRAGALVAVLAEVNNTFGERCSYVLPGAAWGRELQASKTLHVSPFCRVEGGYRFRFMARAPWAAGGRLLARVDHDDVQGLLLQTSLGVALAPLGRAALARALLAMPLLTLGVSLRIHWQALRLWLRGVPVQTRPAALPPSRLTGTP